MSNPVETGKRSTTDTAWTRSRVGQHLGDKLRQVREARDINTDSLAENLGMTTVAYSRLEEGREIVDVGSLFGILHILCADIRDVWPACSEEPPSSASPLESRTKDRSPEGATGVHNEAETSTRKASDLAKQ